MASVGDTIFLDYQLHDYSTDKFVRATIKADGVELTVSPILVPHIGDGAHFYADSNILDFPINVQEIAITYSVYLDSGLTNRLKRYGAGRDYYRLISVSASTDPDLVNKIDQLSNVFNSKEIALASIVDDVILNGKIDNTDIYGNVLDIGDEILASIFDLEPEVVGSVLDNELIGTVLDTNI